MATLGRRVPTGLVQHDERLAPVPHRRRTRAEGATLDGNIWTRGDQRWLPLYEAKMAHHFNHRFGDYAMKTEDTGGNGTSRRLR